MVQVVGGGKVLILGALPPPQGGVSIHCERIAAALTEAGHRVDVVNMRRRPPGPELSGWSGLRRLISARADGSVVFVQFSAGESLRRAVPLLMAFGLVSLRRAVLVQHSGGYPRVLSSPSLGGRIHRFLVRRSRASLCLSSVLQDSIAEIAPQATTRRCPSFVESADLRACAAGPRQDSRSVLTSGYPTDIYRYEETIEVWQSARSRLSGVDYLDIYLYGPADRDYLERVSAVADRDPSVRIFRDTAPRDFLAALRNATAYIRNTSHDSYGVAVAEALYLGTPAVASDVCDRAEGAVLFKAGATAELEARLIEVVSAPRQRVVPSAHQALRAYESFLEEALVGT